MKKIFFLLMLFMLPIALAHTDEFGEVSNEIHFMHKGALKFPVWTYYAEIVEHLVMVVVVAIALYAVYAIFSRFHIKKRGIFNLFVYGFLLIGVGELLTLLHHFLIYPLGVLNAVFNHGLLVIGVVFLCIGFVKLVRYEESKKRRK